MSKRPEAPAGAKAFVEQMLKHLDAIMRKSGTIPITVFLVLKNKAIIPFVFDNDADDIAAKDGFADLIDLLATGLGAECLAVASEAWSLRQEDAMEMDAEEILRHGISKHPKRIEVISLQCQWPHVIVSTQAEIKRQGKAYDGHAEPSISTWSPDEMKSRFGGIIREVSPAERAEAREAIAAALGPRASELFSLADAPTPTTN